MIRISQQQRNNIVGLPIVKTNFFLKQVSSTTPTRGNFSCGDNSFFSSIRTNSSKGQFSNSLMQTPLSLLRNKIGNKQHRLNYNHHCYYSPFSSLFVSSFRSTSSFHNKPSSTLSSWNNELTSFQYLRTFASSSTTGTTTDDNDTSTTKATTTMITPEVEGSVETLEFQAETRQLLDIVIHSLYTDKDVFVRELVSNASDALEKLRHLQATNTSNLIDYHRTNDDDNSISTVPLEIRIDLDEVTSSITISDTGIGMTREEMITNLGTIARSGSKAFVKDLVKQNDGNLPTSSSSSDAASSIIGQFGVGFYSSFMVADKVEVRSRSALAAVPDDETTTTDGQEQEHQLPPAFQWTSDGVMGSFQITKLSDDINQERGSSIVLYMNEKYWDYIDENKMETILKRYSNFVNFPIYLNGKQLNTQQALWSLDPKDISEEEYIEFYKYYANAIDDPLDIHHYRADAPIDMKVLFYTPSFHSEKYGMGRMEPGVSLYSRKILIESKSPDILPEWMRFVKGVVDSEDLPLAISREKTQDSALIAKLRRTLVRKYIAHLTSMKKKDPIKFVNEFYKEYSYFIKEGICQDYEFQNQLAKLLHFHTSKDSHSKMISLDEYISNMRPEQKDIYYLVAPSRSAAISSPYLEAFNKANVDVLFLYTAIEDFVMANLNQYEGRTLVSVERGDIDLSVFTADKENTDDNNKNETTTSSTTTDNDDDNATKLYHADRELTSSEIAEFCEWFRTEVGTDKVSKCTVTKRLTSSPAIVTDNESGAMRRMMRLIDTSNTDGISGRDGIPLPKQQVEINTKHKIIVGIYDIIKTEPVLAKVLAQQVYDNCLVAAGLLDDSRTMIPRLNDLLICVVNGAKQQHEEKEKNQNASAKATTPSDSSTNTTSSTDTDSGSPNQSNENKEDAENAK